MRNLQHKIALVTGGASGIGLGMVRAFLEEHMRVVVADWNAEHLAAARQQLPADGSVHFLRMDVADRHQWLAAADEVRQVFGKLHVLCNNAGVGGGRAADDPDFADWDRTLAINLGGVVNGVKVMAPLLKSHGEGGHVVNTASAAALVPLPGDAAYSASKHAVKGYSESLRMALAPYGIGVSCLFPGMTRSALLPLPADDAEVPPGPEGEYLRNLRAAMRAAMDPLDLGRRVVQGIRENRFHLLTHAEFLAEVQALHRELEAAFPEGQTVPEARAAFERTRRAMAAALLHAGIGDRSTA
jgi:NAD(P)-dependent dehydrogenase (short-subunit alcohol dehydrogenase family)